MKKPNGFQILLIREIKKKQKTFYKTVENRGQTKYVVLKKQKRQNRLRKNIRGQVFILDKLLFGTSSI
jgi:hypothetical protein